MGYTLLAIIKLIITILLIPVVYAVTMILDAHLGGYPSTFRTFLFWGAGSFVFFFLFVYQFWGLYEIGQKTMVNLFQFLAPFDKIFSYSVPFFTLLILLFHFAVKQLLDVDGMDPYLIYFAGFTLSMHILCTAQDLQGQEKYPIKPNYLFNMTFCYIVNIFILILLLDLVTGDVTFLDFFSEMAAKAGETYQTGIDRFILFR